MAVDGAVVVVVVVVVVIVVNDVGGVATLLALEFVTGAAVAVVGDGRRCHEHEVSRRRVVRRGQLRVGGHLDLWVGTRDLRT